MITLPLTDATRTRIAALYFADYCFGGMIREEETQAEAARVSAACREFGVGLGEKTAVAIAARGGMAALRAAFVDKT